MKNTLSLFWAAAIMNLSGHLFGVSELAMLTKPFLMITLAHYAWHMIEPNMKLANSLAIALILSWLGDVFLIFGSNKIFFILGLISFAAAHVTYAIMFLKWSRSSDGKLFYPALLGAIPILIFAYIYGTYLWERTGDFRIPVMVYLILICCMSILSISRFGVTNLKSYVWTVLGTSLFMVSDSVLAYGKFVEGFPFQGFAIMLTYILGQWCIAKGMIEHAQK